MTTIENTISFKVPDTMWPPALEAFRALRKMHQATGGTSRLTKNKDIVTLTVKGDANAVLDAMSRAKAIESKVSQKKEDIMDMLRDSLRRGEARKEQRKEEFLGMVAEELMKKRKQ
jgi:hypothetical protein